MKKKYTQCFTGEYIRTQENDYLGYYIGEEERPANPNRKIISDVRNINNTFKNVTRLKGPDSIQANAFSSNSLST